MELNQVVRNNHQKTQHICASMLLLLILTFFSVERIQATIIATHTIKIHSLCAQDNDLVVLLGKQLPMLLGHDIESLSLFSYRKALADSHLSSSPSKIRFQIDQRDEKGRFILPLPDDIRNTKHLFNKQDELVFREKDLAQRIEQGSPWLQESRVIELELLNNEAVSKWLYIRLNNPISEAKLPALLDYDVEHDTIIGADYKLGFSKSFPFLVDKFHWRVPHSSQWGNDLSDTMKIRHKGNFLGFAFERDQDDYYSSLVALKKGPLRIIRRTENKIKVLWKLKSPSLFIDYVMMPSGFVMDTMVDIPFSVGLFFSHLETLTTMDWNPVVQDDALVVQASQDYPKIVINGMTSDAQKQFNQTLGTEFSLLSRMGRFRVMLDVPDNFPIQSQLYLQDAIDKPDPPESSKGQFGNIGFKTTGWENADNQLYHLKFTVCVKLADQ